MLQVRYNKATGVLTGWWATRHGNHRGKLRGRPGEAIIKLDTALPGKSLKAWLLDLESKSLAPNPDYVEPREPRDLAAEIDDLKVRLDAIAAAQKTNHERG